MDHENHEKMIMDYIVSDYSWEQVIYKVIAMEGMDPWDLDLIALSNFFMRYMQKLEELDFKIPAKYVIIVAVLLRMKSDYLRYVKDQIFKPEENDIMQEIEGNGEALPGEIEKLDVAPISVPPKREPKRNIVVTELIDALKKVLSVQERRETKIRNAINKIDINRDDINQRIKNLYTKITSLVEIMKGNEVKFSSLVEKWEREEIIGTFLPLVFLDHQGKVNCRQERIFDEIWIRRASKVS